MHSIDKFDAKRFIIFSIPLSLQFLLRNIVGLTDNFMVGRLGEQYMAGLTVATRYFFVFTILIWTFTNAGGIIATQLWGKKDINGFKRAVGLSILMSSLISIILTAILYQFSWQCAALISDDPVVIGYASQYMKIISLSFILVAFNSALSIAFNSSGDSKAVFFQQLATTIINVVLNYLLIYGNFGFPRLEIAGAAWASVISFLAGNVIFVFTAINKGKMPTLRNIIVPDIGELKDMMKLSFPILADMAIWQISGILYLDIVGTAGSSALAVFGAVGQFQSILWIITSGFITSAGITAGHLIGAGDKEEAYNFIKKAYKFTLLASIIPSLIMIAFSWAVPSIFKISAGYTIICITAIIILAGRQFFTISCGLLSTSIRAGKDTFFIMMTTFIGLCIGYPLAYLAGPVFRTGFIVIFVAISADEIVKTIIFYLRFNSKKWLKSV